MRTIKQRGKEHMKDLRHPEKHKYISDNSCEIRVIEYCDLADKRKREDFWINLWKPRFNRRFEIAKKRVNVNKQIEMKMADDKAKQIIKKSVRNDIKPDRSLKINKTFIHKLLLH